MTTLKKMVTVVMAVMMVMAMSLTAFASNSSGTYLYYDSALTSAAPSHAQSTIDNIVTVVGDDTTYVAITIKEVSYGTETGKITTMTIDGQTETAKNDVITFKDVDNDVIASNGAVPVSLTITYGEHENDLNNLYLALN